MTSASRVLSDRVKHELPVAGLVLLLMAPIVFCFITHPSMKVLLLMLCVFPIVVLATRRLYDHGGLIYLALYLLLLYILLIPGLFSQTSVRYYLFYYSLTVLILSPLLLFEKVYTLAKTLCILSVLVVLSINLAFTAYALQAGVPMNRAALLAVYQTDVNEAAGYIEAFTGPSLVIGLVLALVGLLLLVAQSRPPAVRAFSRPWQLVVIAIALALAWETRASSNEFQVYSTVRSYRDTLQDYREASAQRRTDYREIDARLIRETLETHVVVIGESSTRNHMDIYGYFRPTTPNLHRIKDELIIFTDVISNHSHTMYVLEKALTLANQDNRMKYSDADAYSLLELLKAASVTTYWLSNHNRFGIWDNVVTIIAEGADYVRFVSERIGEDYGASPDENLLLPLREALQDGAETKVIFLHLMGTHGPYHRRYPPDFARFSGPLPAGAFGAWQDRGWIGDVATRVNDYDNAIAYTDHILHEVIEILKEHESAASLLYFSDHGEAPLEGTGHDSALFSRNHVEIPFLFWFSDDFKKTHGDMVANLSEN